MNEEIEISLPEATWKSKLRDKFREWWTLPRIIGIFSLILGLAGILEGPIPYLPIPGLPGFHRAISSELVGIGVTVLIIDYANERRQKQQLKSALIRDLGSQSNEFALRALRELKYYGWHNDGSLKQAHLSSANLKSALLHNSDLEQTYLMWANLEDADLRKTNLKGANLYSANLKGAKLTDAMLNKARMFGVDLKNSQLMVSNLESATLTAATLEKANLFKANLRRTNLAGARLKGAKLLEADLREADLSMADLRETDLGKADLRGALLRDAVFDGANLWRANLHGVDGITNLQFSKVRSLLEATMPDSQSYEEWVQTLTDDSGNSIAERRTRNNTTQKSAFTNDSNSLGHETEVYLNAKRQPISSVIVAITLFVISIFIWFRYLRKYI